MKSEFASLASTHISHSHPPAEDVIVCLLGADTDLRSVVRLAV